jgi:Fe-S-cluster containining protein
LARLGLPVSGKRAAGGPGRFPQPCAALEGCRCRIYADRPIYCRHFECLLLKRVQAGDLEESAARSIISSARAQADKVRYLLETLGENDQKRALGLRFQRLSRKLEKIVGNEHETELFSQITLAVHNLNLVISEQFYPGSI